ncbi:MAG TPA: hypothetical protein VHJ38_10820, partial [Nitrososphaeraceae archaeon]|nr:hypothetical protein [Nitrososphaeraceae archaeon]
LELVYENVFVVANLGGKLLEVKNLINSKTFPPSFYLVLVSVLHSSVDFIIKLTSVGKINRYIISSTYGKLQYLLGLRYNMYKLL